MRNYPFLLSLTAYALNPLISQAQSTENNQKQLNVLLVTADDLNCNSIGAYGCPVRNISPNIDRLAQEGIQFMNAHVAIAVSQPSRGALATGRYPHCSGIEGFYHTNQEIPAIVPTLKKAGYYCGLLGKMDHSSPTADTPWDYKLDMEDLGWGRDASRYRTEMKHMLEEAHKANKPFYFMINSHDPHRPFFGSEWEKNLFKGQQIPLPSYIYTESEVNVPGFLCDLPGVRKEMTQYYNSVKRLDDMVGVILKVLKDTDQMNNTIIMFLSDNGMSQPFSKTNCYYQSTKTPWIVYAPTLYRSGCIDKEHFISGIDFFPTITDILGLPTPKGIDGRSFKTILEGKKQTNREYVFTEFQSTSGQKAFPMRCVQDKNYAYIFNPWAIDSIRFTNESLFGDAFKEMQRYAPLNEKVADRVNMNLYRSLEEFYDIEKDPNALHNLIHHPAYQDEIKKYRTLMLKQMEKTNDPLKEAFTHRDDINIIRKVLNNIQEYVIKRHKENSEKVKPMH